VPRFPQHTANTLNAVYGGVTGRPSTSRQRPFTAEAAVRCRSAPLSPLRVDPDWRRSSRSPRRGGVSTERPQSSSVLPTTSSTAFSDNWEQDSTMTPTPQRQRFGVGGGGLFGASDSLESIVRALEEQSGLEEDGELAAEACQRIEEAALADAGPRGGGAAERTTSALTLAAPAMVATLRAHRARSIRVAACRALTAAIFAGGAPVATAVADGFTARGQRGHRDVGLQPLLGMIRQSANTDEGQSEGDEDAAAARVTACSLLIALSAHSKRSPAIAALLKPAMPLAFDVLLSASIPEKPSLPSHKGFGREAL